MSQAFTCEKCGARFPASTAGGLCPSCLLRVGLDEASPFPVADPGDEAPPVGSAPASAAGRAFGDYELLEEIGRGGVGVIYRARQRSLGREVALKLLVAGEFAGPDVLRRFRDEAHAAARLQHPNIVTVHEAGEHDGLAFLSMEYVAGTTLAQEVREHPLPPRAAATCVATIAGAIDHAHSQGLLHRDLKPSNVLIDAQGRPRITDFGLAKEFTGNQAATRSAQFAGTVGYMAPEQADPRLGPMSPASDVYSLGAILYHLLTGRAPFASGSLPETLEQVLTTPPMSPRLLNDRVPRDLETICLRCLAKDPDRRYPRASDVARELERHLEGRPILARPVGPFERLWAWCRRQPSLAAMIGLVFALLVILAGGSTMTALRIQRARESEANQRARAERSVVQLQLRHADDLLREGRVAPGLAQLARVLRLSPTQHVAAARIASVLTRHDFAIPLTPPFRHQGAVVRASFSPDNSHVATASSDGTARIWDVRTGLPAGPPLRHSAEVVFARFVDSGAVLLTASRDGTLQRWHSPGGSPAAPPWRHGGVIDAVELSADLKVVATAGGDSIRLWDVADGLPRGGPLGDGGRMGCLDLTADGALVAAGCADRQVRVWEAGTGRRLLGLPHASRIRFIAWNVTGKLLATACDDGRARVFSIPEGTRLCEVAHAGLVEHASFSPDGLHLVTTSRDGTARIWDATTGEPRTPPLVHYSVVRDAAFSADGTRLATTCWDNTAWIWETRTGRRWAEPLRHEGRIHQAAFSSDGYRMVTASADASALVWDIRRGREAFLRLPGDAGAGVSFSPDGTRALTWSMDGLLRIWDASDAAPRTPEFRHTGGITWATYSPDGRRVASASFDHTAAVWDADTGRRIVQFTGHTGVVEYVEFSPDGAWAVTAGRDGTARAWDTATGAPVTPVLRHDSRVWKAHFSSDLRHIATCSDDGTGRLWTLPEGRPVGGPLRHQGPVFSIRFSADGRRVVTASEDGTARVWNVDTAQPALPPWTHAALVRHAEFSPQGNRVITASGDNTARLWDAINGQPLGEALQHQSDVWMARFSPDGSRVATLAQDGSARLWDGFSGQPLSEPIRSQSRWARLAFSPDGTRLGLGQTEGGAQLIDLPPRVSPPTWLSNLAEAVAAQEVAEPGQPRSIPPTNLASIRDALATKGNSSTDPWTRLGRWYFADRDQRALGPAAAITIPQWIQRLGSENRLEAWQDVLDWYPDSVEARWQAAYLAGSEDPNPAAPYRPDAAVFRDWARHLPEAGWAEAEKLEDSDLDRAVEALDRATARPPPQDPRYWMTRGRILARTPRLDEALRAFARLDAVAPAGEPWPDSVRNPARIARRLLRQRTPGGAHAGPDDAPPMPIPTRDPRSGSHLIDLSRVYNAGLAEPWHDANRPRNHLGLLDAGLHRLDGIEFDIRGILQVGGRHLHHAQPGYPTRIQGIPIGRNCHRLHFLHAAGWAGFVPWGTHLGSYRIHFQDGEVLTIPLVNGEDLFEWLAVPGGENGLARASVAWRGQTPEGSGARLFHRAWENPRPGIRIESLELVSSETAAAPFLVAITAAP